MTELAERALLPAGLRDILPPFAAHEAEIVSRLMGVFAAHGYDRVKPPLLEFETSFFDQAGPALSQTFRVMDPLTQRMMAVRSDITPQVARIAATRLAREPRPLRLAYAGQVLRIQGTQLRAERQFGQVGFELIGATEASAEAEIVTLCADALQLVGLKGISVDLTMATLVPLVLGEQNDDHRLRDALDHKDVTMVTANGGHAAKLLTGLIEAVGPADRALARLAALDLPAPAARERDRLNEVVALIRKAAPALTLTIDPVENRGVQYYTGVGFTLFAQGCGGEIGRGGRYLSYGEPAVGATLFMDGVLQILPESAAKQRLYVPAGSDAAIATNLRDTGWITINGLANVTDAKAEARRLRCDHVLVNDRPEPV
jgi:ATP phosphoribosyltransferase regulatory subunit